MNGTALIAPAVVVVGIVGLWLIGQKLARREDTAFEPPPQAPESPPVVFEGMVLPEGWIVPQQWRGWLSDNWKPRGWPRATWEELSRFRR